MNETPFLFYFLFKGLYEALKWTFKKEKEKKKKKGGLRMEKNWT
jgi:hypothetical protein